MNPDNTGHDTAEQDQDASDPACMTNAELAAFRARVRAWDAQHPEITAGWTAERRGY